MPETTEKETWKVRKCIECGYVGHTTEAECESCGSNDIHADIVNQIISINVLTDDEDLATWCEDNWWSDLTVTAVDHESGLVWVKDCPYAIQVKDIA